MKIGFGITLSTCSVIKPCFSGRPHFTPLFSDRIVFFILTVDVGNVENSN